MDTAGLPQGMCQSCRTAGVPPASEERANGVMRSGEKNMSGRDARGPARRRQLYRDSVAFATDGDRTLSEQCLGYSTEEINDGFYCDSHRLR